MLNAIPLPTHNCSLIPLRSEARLRQVIIFFLCELGLPAEYSPLGRIAVYQCLTQPIEHKRVSTHKSGCRQEPAQHCTNVTLVLSCVVALVQLQLLQFYTDLKCISHTFGIFCLLSTFCFCLCSCCYLCAFLYVVITSSILKPQENFPCTVNVCLLV